MIRQDRQIQQILFLWCFVFFLHAVVDPAITYLAVVILDVGAEVNPLLRVWLQHGWRSFLLIHMPLYALGVGGIVLLRWLFRQADRHEQRQAYWLALIVMSGLSIWGVVLVVNNLWVILAGI